MSSMTAEEYSGFLKLASVLVRFDHIASIIVTQMVAHRTSNRRRVGPYGVGRGSGVGRGRGVGTGLGVGVILGVAVGVGVAVGWG